MKNTKKPANKFPVKWAGSVDDFDFNPGGRPVQLPAKTKKPASKKEALKEILNNVLGNEKK